MMIEQTWRNWFGATLGVVALVVFSIRYVDRPLARAMGALPHFHHVIVQAPVSFPILLIVAGFTLLLAVGIRLLGKPLSRWMTAGTIAGIALIVSVFLIENWLKYVFGRTLPIEYLKSGQYGFHWFHSGDRFMSFPSGHTDQFCAIFSVLWFYYPRWRMAYVTVLIILSIALMAGQWHFLSDIIAGGYLGTVAGITTMSIWTAIAARSSKNQLDNHNQLADTQQPPL